MPVSPRISRLPLAWGGFWFIVLSAAFLSVSWAYIDVHNVFREAATWSWRQYVRFAFTRGIEYRPLFTLSVKLAYEVVGAQVWFFQTLVLLQFGAVIGLLIWIARPLGLLRGIAACVALSCILGLHTSRVLFTFVPLNAYSGVLVLILLAMALALGSDSMSRPVDGARPHDTSRLRVALDWVLLPLTFLAMLLLESGAIIVPLMIVLWRLGAPGLTRRGIAATVMGAVVYFAIRLTFGRLGDVVIHTGSGLGFSEMSSEQLRNVFEHAPWLFWIYNLCASLLTLIASEPRAGVYRFVDALLRGQAAPWQWVHVASSLLTTAVIALALAARRPYSARDRQLIASGLVLFVCGVGLGVLYTRDRIGLFAGVGYGILLYVACAAWLERPPAIRWWRPIAAGAIALVALAWTVRCTEAYFQLRDMAWDHYVEWTERYEDLGGSAQPLTPLLKTLRSAAMDVAPADPRRGPAWSYALFERRFTRSGRPAASPDRAADAAVAPLSTRFNIRWKPDVDEAARLRLEGELGLAEGSPVDRDATGRTWEYRLRRPTPERIRALVLSEAVDDTANIDPERFEILR